MDFEIGILLMEEQIFSTIPALMVSPEELESPNEIKRFKKSYTSKSKKCKMTTFKELIAGVGLCRMLAYFEVRKYHKLLDLHL